MRRAAVLAAAMAALLAGCAPKAPDGVDKARLDEMVSRAIGDPGTCVLIARRGKVVYQYGSHMVCGRSLPTCEGAATRTLAELIAQAPSVGDPKTASCPSNPDQSRTVAWAAGPVAGRDLVYAAVMEGDQTPPGIVVADKLKTAFQRAGLTAE